MYRHNDCSTFKEWMLKQFNHSELASMVHFGVDCGWKGLSTFNDTLTLYDQHHQEICRIVNAAYKAQGYSSIFECLEKEFPVNAMNESQFKMLLVWYAAMNIAFDITQGRYPDEPSCDTNVSS